MPSEQEQLVVKIQRLEAELLHLRKVVHSMYRPQANANAAGHHYCFEQASVLSNAEHSAASGLHDKLTLRYALLRTP